MPARYEIDSRDANVVAGFIAAGAVVVYIAFYFLSQAYFDDRAKNIVITDEHIRDVRVAFGVLDGVLAAFGILAARYPRAIGHSLAALAGVTAVVGALALPDVNLVMPIALFVFGALFLVLTWQSLERSRLAWAFLVGVTSVFAVLMLFGSTKLRDQLQRALEEPVSLYYPLIVPGLLAVATVAFALIRREYREST
ncbi:MAG: hypothetical protein SFX73_29200 [Kofleriaceae bacterium]|nr:hypothetical protein [Kofleriaceae bacterium]